MRRLDTNSSAVPSTAIVYTLLKTRAQHLVEALWFSCRIAVGRIICVKLESHLFEFSYPEPSLTKTARLANLYRQQILERELKGEEKFLPKVKFTVSL